MWIERVGLCGNAILVLGDLGKEDGDWLFTAHVTVKVER